MSTFLWSYLTTNRQLSNKIPLLSDKEPDSVPSSNVAAPTIKVEHSSLLDKSKKKPQTGGSSKPLVGTSTVEPPPITPTKNEFLEDETAITSKRGNVSSGCHAIFFPNLIGLLYCNTNGCLYCRVRSEIGLLTFYRKTWWTNQKLIMLRNLLI